MKFKATFGSPVQLSKLIQTLDKLAETCVVHLTPTMLHFGVVSESKDALNMHVSAEISQAMVFLEYTVQSKAEGNRISFFVKIENLSRALRSCCSAQMAEHIQLKLTKKQGVPALSFEIHESKTQVLHEVPIRIVADPRETAPYLEPPVGSADGAIPVIFPAREFKSLKNVVERMKTVADWMRLTTSRGQRAADALGGGGEIDGGGVAELQLLVERPELVKIKTTYPKLGVPTAVADEDDGAGGAGGAGGATGAGGGGGGIDLTAPGADVAETATATVEVKKLLRVLQSLSASDLKIQNAIVCIVPHSMVILKIYLPDTTQKSFMIYFLPVMADGDDY